MGLSDSSDSRSFVNTTYNDSIPAQMANDSVYETNDIQ